MKTFIEILSENKRMTLKQLKKNILKKYGYGDEKMLSYFEKIKYEAEVKKEWLKFKKK